MIAEMIDRVSKLTVMDKYDNKDDDRDGDDGEVGCLTTMDMAPEGGCRS